MATNNNFIIPLITKGTGIAQMVLSANTQTTMSISNSGYFCNSGGSATGKTATVYTTGHTYYYKLTDGSAVITIDNGLTYVTYAEFKAITNAPDVDNLSLYDLPTTLKNFKMVIDSGNLTGGLGALAYMTGLTRFDVTCESSINGDLYDLPDSITYFKLTESTGLISYSGYKDWNNNINHFTFNPSGGELDSLQVDLLLNDLSLVNWSGTTRTVNLLLNGVTDTGFEDIITLSGKSVNVFVEYLRVGDKNYISNGEFTSAINLSASTNLLTNGNFSSGLSDWAWYDAVSGGTPTIVSGGTCKLTPKYNFDWSQYQLAHENFLLEPGKKYRLVFTSWASTNEVVAMSLTDAVYPWPSAGYSYDSRAVLPEFSGNTNRYLSGRTQWTVSLTTTPQIFEYDFFCDRQFDDNRIAYLLAVDNYTCFLDDVYIVELYPGWQNNSAWVQLSGQTLLMETKSGDTSITGQVDFRSIYSQTSQIFEQLPTNEPYKLRFEAWCSNDTIVSNRFLRLSYNNVPTINNSANTWGEGYYRLGVSYNDTTVWDSGATWLGTPDQNKNITDWIVELTTTPTYYEVIIENFNRISDENVIINVPPSGIDNPINFGITTPRLEFNYQYKPGKVFIDRVIMTRL